MIKPYDWQQPTVNRGNDILQRVDLLLNTSDTGTGKTVCTLQTIKDLGLRALIIAPKSVHTAWRVTARDMGLKIHDVINPERLQYTNPYYTSTGWHLDDVDCVVVDEIHKGASGEKSKTTQIIGELKAYDVKVIALSATIADSPLKLRCVGYLAGLHQFNKNSWLRWCLAHACYKMPGVRKLRFNPGPKGQLAISDIARNLKPYMVRIDSSKAPGFPESMVNVDLYDLEARDLAEFNRIMDEMEDYLKDTVGANPLTEMLRARQRTELLKIPVLLDLVLDAINDGLAPVVFVNFRETLEELQRRLNAIGTSTAIIYGGQKIVERDSQIDSFQTDTVPCLLATISAGGVGISLHAKKDSTLRNRTSFITPSFSASELVQALGRIHRAGGYNVVQHIVLAAGTIEEKIHLALRGKVSRIDTINDGDLV